MITARTEFTQTRFKMPANRNKTIRNNFRLMYQRGTSYTSELHTLLTIRADEPVSVVCGVPVVHSKCHKRTHQSVTVILELSINSYIVLETKT